MTKQTRYKLKISKFGFYFLDSKTKNDLTLEMVLNRLNNYEININKQYNKLNNLKKELYKLKRSE